MAKTSSESILYKKYYFFIFIIMVFLKNDFILFRYNFNEYKIKINSDICIFN